MLDVEFILFIWIPTSQPNSILLASKIFWFMNNAVRFGVLVASSSRSNSVSLAVIS